MANKRVTVYFATNRLPMLEDGTEKIVNFSSELGPTGGLDVRYGSAQVDVDLARNTTAVVAGSLKIADERQVPTAEAPRLLGSNTIFEAIRVDMTRAEAADARLHPRVQQQLHGRAGTRRLESRLSRA